MRLQLQVLLLSAATISYAELASRCSSILPTGTTVACVNRYGAVMPLPFNRPFAQLGAASSGNDSFRLTSIPSDPSFELVTNADFLVFDEVRGQQILGNNPSYEFVFANSSNVHEAPVYVPWLNSFIFSVLGQDIYEQQLMNISTNPPTFHNYTTTPPIYAVNGGRLFNGSIYWAADGGYPFPDPSNSSLTILQQPGIYKLNPNTSSVETLLNNYFGTPFNSPDDLVIAKNGDIFFNDPWYGYGLNFTARRTFPPQTWRFRPSTGQASVVDNTSNQPNGIALSPDEKTLYVTDTGTSDFNIPSSTDGGVPRYTWNPLGPRVIYAFDTVDSPAGKYLINKRPIYQAEEGIDDGFHVSVEGYLVGAAGYGVDVVSPYGELIVRISTPNIYVNNIQFGGPKQGQLSDLWLFGAGGVARVKWNLTGMAQE